MTEIENTIADICNADDSTIQNMSLRKVADFYRNGAMLYTLFPLLRSSRPRVVQCGAWVASEVADSKKGREVFKDLVRLLNHSDDEVRFLSIEGVAILARSTDTAAVHRLIELLIDPSRQVRLCALRWICLMPNATIESLDDTDYSRLSALMVGHATQDEIVSSLGSTDAIEQRAAVAAAMRNHGDNDFFISTMVEFLDRSSVSEITSQIPSLPRCLQY